MIRHILAALAIGALIAAHGVAAETKKSVLKVSGMSCGSCVSTVKKTATKVEGVSDAAVSLEKGEAEVSFDPAKTTPEEIAKAITKAGFKSEPKK